MEKLTIKHLAPYLPYKLKVLDTVVNKTKVVNLGQGGSVNWVGVKTVLSYAQKTHIYKPILRPLSDLNKKHVDILYFDILSTDNDMYGSRSEFEDTLDENLYDLSHLPLFVYNYLVENHFDVFGLIPQGLAIDKNTIL